MTTFEDIMAAILIDIIKAQNRANKYSAELVPQYRDPTLPNLGFLPIPNTAIKSFDVKVSFAMAELPPLGTPGTPPGNLFNDIHNVLAEVIDLIGPPAIKIEPNKKTEMFTRLKQAYFSLLADNKQTTTEKTALLTEQILKETEFAIAGHSADEKKDLRRKISESLQRNLKFSHEQGLPVNLDLEVLKEAGDKTLATVNCQVDMRNYQLGFTEYVDEGGSTSKHASLYPA